MIKEPYKGQWVTIIDGTNIHIVPKKDIKPHSHGEKGANNKMLIAGATCECNPIVEFNGNGFIIKHRSFVNNEYLDEKMKELGVEE